MSEAVAHAPPADIHEPWHTAERQRAAMQFGFWIFLATEMLFFGGLFLFYATLRVLDPVGLAAGSHEADLAFGTANTVILTTSSVAIVVAERALKAGWMGWARWCLAATLALAVAFLVVKGFEYAKDLHEHLWPGPGFTLPEPGARRFWSFYWTATGIHAIHITVGIALVARLLWLDRAGLLGRRWMGVEVTTLYWHFVELVWLTLYPLIYLAGR